MVLATTAAIVSVIGSAVQIARAFSTQSSTSIGRISPGRGFTRFFSASTTTTMSFPLDRAERYVQTQVSRILNNRRISASQAQDIVNFMDDFQVFSADEVGEWANTSSTIIDYNNTEGMMNMYIYCFLPYINANDNRIHIRSYNIKLSAQMRMARSWMIVSKMKSSFFSSSYREQIEFVPPEMEGLQAYQLVDAISIALLPATLGIIQLPTPFIDQINKMILDQISQRGQDIVPLSQAERESLMQQWNEMKNRQDNWTQSAGTAAGSLYDQLAGGNRSASNNYVRKHHTRRHHH